MPSDVVIANVIANEPPTMTAPAFHTTYEGVNARLVADIYRGRPGADFFKVEVYRTAFDAIQGRNIVTRASASEAPSVSGGHGDYTWNPLTFNRRTTGIANVDVPMISGTTPRQWYLRWILGYRASDGTLDRNKPYVFRYTIFKILQSILADISIAPSFEAQEETDFALPYNVVVGSPRATLVRHSWHQTAQDSIDDTNEVTVNRPAITNSITTAVLQGHNIESGNLNRSGTLSGRTPAVTERTQFYGRVEILQPPLDNPDGTPAVVAFDTYILNIVNRVQPMISVPAVSGIEGTEVPAMVRYIGGSPRPDRWEVDYAGSLTNARNGNFLNANDRRRPTAYRTDHARPRQGAQEWSMGLHFTLPYVDRDETVYARVRMVATNVDNTETYTDGYCRIRILNRIEACVSFPMETTFDEETDDHEVIGWFQEGLPPATSMDVTVHEDGPDATADRDAVTGSNHIEARLSVTNITAVNDPTRRRPVSLFLDSPDITENEDWGIRVDINQPGYGPDPT